MISRSSMYASIRRQENINTRMGTHMHIYTCIHRLIHTYTYTYSTTHRCAIGHRSCAWRFYFKHKPARRREAERRKKKGERRSFFCIVDFLWKHGFRSFNILHTHGKFHKKTMHTIELIHQMFWFFSNNFFVSFSWHSVHNNTRS